MFEVGQKVKVTDQRPPVVGVVEQVSTWREILGEPNSDNPCYRIRCADWMDTDRWISALFVVEMGIEPDICQADEELADLMNRINYGAGVT